MDHRDDPTSGAALVTTDVERAVDALRRGGLVAIPTETVYGLGALATDPIAVQRVFETKGRPTGHPLIVHVESAEHLEGWADHLSHAAHVLTSACWPGPLTVLVPRGPRVLDVVTGGRPSVGIRVPAHPDTIELLRRLGSAIVAPSANRFGAVSPTRASHVVDDLGRHLVPGLDVVLDGGPCPVGVESTIVDCTTDPPQVLRPGGIPTEEIERLLQGALAPASGPSRAAGMLESHYAPRCTLHLAVDASDGRRLVDALAARGRPAELLDPTTDLVAAARDLYARLRDADRRGVEDLVVVMPPPVGLGHAIRDRLTKAAAGRPAR